MHEILKTKQHGLVNRDGPILRHDNEWSHSSQARVKKLQNKGIWSSGLDNEAVT